MNLLEEKNLMNLSRAESKGKVINLKGYFLNPLLMEIGDREEELGKECENLREILIKTTEWATFSSARWEKNLIL